MKRFDKRGVSVMVGYVLLISFVLVISVLVYQWMRTYIPQASIECPDGVSVFIEDNTCTSNSLNLTLKNNGKFNIGGFFIRATDAVDQDLATLDLSPYIASGGDYLAPTGIKSLGNDNSMKPNQEDSFSFNISKKLYSVEIIPIRFEEINNRKRLVSCQTAKIRESISCP